MQAVEGFRIITDFPPNPILTPNPMQEAMWNEVLGNDCAVLLKSPTGSGKTEAVLIPALWTVLQGQEAERRRLFMIYPSRSLVEDQIQRIQILFSEISQKHQKRLSLVVDTGGQSIRRIWENGQENLPDKENLSEDALRWKERRRRRHLYDGDVIITTLDKFLYRFFGFGEERKSYIFPFRIFHGLRRNLFVFDEAHAYEDTAFTNFVNLIKALYTANLDLVVMTATMPDNYARELGFLRTIDYLSSNQPHTKILRYVPLNDKTPLVEAILKQVNLLQAPDRRLIVTVEFVQKAVEVWEGLGKPLLYHGRLDNQQRWKVYAELKRKECNGEGYLLVTTSAIEVGCDLNADYLITEICNPASLIQRTGRCNRRGDRPNAEVVVVGNAINRHLRDISDEQESEFIAALRRKTGELFQPADFFRFMERSVTFDYRVEILFDMLFEYVYEGKLENKPLHDKGLVVTRSWEPSITLTTNKETMAHAISVPLNRCLTAADKVDNECKVYVRYFNRKFHSQNEYEIVFKELQWGGCAYFHDLVIEAPPIDPVRGWVEIPRPFIRGRQEGYRVTVRYPRKEDDRDVYLFFIRWRPETEEPTQPLETTAEENTLEETVDNSSDNEP